MPNLKATTSRVDLRKHVSIVHASGELSLLERKIANVLLQNAYDDLMSKRQHHLSIAMMTSMLGFDSKNIEALKSALRNIQQTRIEFDLLGDGTNTEWHSASLLSSVSIVNGECRYEYASWLAEKLSAPETYTLININIQKHFNSSYALALYENCLRFRGTGSTGWIDVSTWRRLLGADAAMYSEFKHFSAEVIKKAVKEINKVSNIVVEPEYQRENRRVVRIRFLVSTNPENAGYDSEAGDAERVRQTDVYQRLLALGIADRLAVSFIQEDSARAEETATYVEQQQQRKKIRGNAGGYAKTVFRSGNPITIGGEAKSKSVTIELPRTDEMQAARESLKAAKTKATTAAIKALSMEQKRELARRFMETEGARTSFNEESVKFKDVVEQTAFTSWLRQTIAAQLEG